MSTKKCLIFWIGIAYITAVSALEKHAVAYITTDFKSDTDDGTWIATIECAFTGTYPSQMSWHLQGKVVGEGNGISIVSDDLGKKTTLTVTKFTQSQVGEYTCLSVDQESRADAAAWLLAPPVIDTADVAKPVDTTITATCTGFPGSTVYWQTTRYISVSTTITNSTTGSWISTLATTVDANDINTIIQCCVVMNDDVLVAKADLCRSFNVSVTDITQLSAYTTSYDSQAAKSTFSCTFEAYPSVDASQIIWNTCSDCTEDGCTTCTGAATATSTVPNGNQLITNLIVADGDAAATGYRCSVKDTEINHSFYYVKGMQSPNSPTTQFRDDGDGNSSITCNFKVDSPNTTVLFYRLSAYQEMVAAYLHTVAFYEEGPSVASTIVVSTYDFDIYYCSIYNEYGSIKSGLIVPEEIPRYHVIGASSRHPPEGDVVTLSCLAFGCPTSKISWRVVADNDIDYTEDIKSENCLTISTVTYTSSRGNDFVKLVCSVSDNFLLWEPVKSQEIISVNHLPAFVEVEVEPCDGKSQCELSCAFQKDHTTRTLEVTWRYFIDDSDTITNVYDHVSVTYDTPGHVKTALNFNNSVNAGVYQCWASYRYYDEKLQGPVDVSVSHNFTDFQQTNGTYIDDDCRENSDCSVLNSICSLDKKCQCPPPYQLYKNVSTANGYINTTCLNAANPDDNCVISQQCASGAYNYYCDEDNTCSCDGTLYVISDKSTQCLNPKTSGQQCKYTEECKLYDFNSVCQSSTCVCFDGFYEDGSYCVYDDDSGTSAGTVIGIIIALMFAVGIVAMVYLAYVRPPTCTWLVPPKPHASNDIPMESTSANSNGYHQEGPTAEQPKIPKEKPKPPPSARNNVNERSVDGDNGHDDSFDESDYDETLQDANA